MMMNVGGRRVRIRVRVLVQVPAAGVPGGRLHAPCHLDGLHRGDAGGGGSCGPHAADVRTREGQKPACRPFRPGGSETGRAGRAPLLPLPAGVGAHVSRAPAEFSGDPDRRLTEHGDCRSRRRDTKCLRAGAVRRSRERTAHRARRPLRPSLLPLLLLH